MFKKALIIAKNESAAQMLLSGVDEAFENLVLVTADESASGADDIYHYAPDTPSVVLAHSIVELAKTELPNLVLCESGEDGKFFAGHVSVALNTSPICDVMSLEYTDSGILTARMAYGGGAISTQSCSFPAVAVISSGAFKQKDLNRAERRHSLELEDVAGIVLVSAKSSEEAKATALSSAKRVVGVGRGISSLENLTLAEKLASLIHAEVGCTRPIAEEDHWYGKERYIGVSGCMLKPNLYLAIGISGQVQHMVGVNQSGVIFAIDKSESAPIIQQADYTLIGDVNTVLPKIIEALSK